MMRIEGLVWVLQVGLIGAGSMAGAAWGAEPSFDCTKASGQVEALICRDDGLAALDRKLASAYARALERVREDGYEDPKVMQRGWVKGRNDCWKAEDVRGCVETQYKHRIAELKIQYGDMVVPTPANFRCGAMDLTAVFYNETDPPAAVLTQIGQSGPDQVIAYQAISGSGARYLGQNVEFWEHQGEASVNWFGQQLTCKLNE
jgi:uncharacterized protein